ncbi:MAG TPA: VIT1/CCC1 transporter family protein, partial [Chitinispirillaceae bacterium]|nr:VIT1/CCC1 transporter family protein [Chitinispirillaceae bacterium]
WAFLIIGILPLIPFLFGNFNYITRFIMSSVITALAFLLIGLVKGAILKTSVIKSGVQTLMTGGMAAFLAYLAGAVLRRFYGVD